MCPCAKFAICEIMNINVDSRIFVNASHSIFSKNNKTQIKLKLKFFLEIADIILSRMLLSRDVPKFRKKY